MSTYKKTDKQDAQIERVSLDKLIPYARNARTHSDAQVSQIAGSIKEFGFCNPVLIDKQGGMSDAYLASGTYVKSFYTTMLFPSFARVTVPRSMNRLHHKISWNNAIPKILDESFKKYGKAV